MSFLGRLASFNLRGDELILLQSSPRDRHTDRTGERA